MSSEKRTVLVVANETLNGDELLDAVRRHAEGGDVLVRVIAPVNAPREGYVVYDNTRRAASGRRLDRTLAQLRAAGITAIGDVIDNDPLTAVRDAIAQDEPDELIVSTHPESKSGWRRRNLVDEIRRVAGDIPIEHVTSNVAERVGARNVLVVANETVLDEELLDRIRAKAKEGERVSFLIICPQSDPGSGAHPEAEKRLRQALATLRAEQIEAHGQVAHPDPYTAAIHAVRDERVDEILVSTFSERRGSSWLRRDLVGRLERDAKVPVEHVVVEPAGTEAHA
ncbi:MAG: universal stress protein [Actinobacteria bacterium]|nr:universal stress protein [Actinomycetota bacterium]